MVLYKDTMRSISEEFKLSKKLAERIYLPPCSNGCGNSSVKKVDAKIITKNSLGQRIVAERYFCESCYSFFYITTRTDRNAPEETGKELGLVA